MCRMSPAARRKRILHRLADGGWHTLSFDLASVAGKMAAEGLLERKQEYARRGDGWGWRVYFRLPGGMGEVVILYTSRRCPSCKQVKQWLQEHGIEFREVSVDEDDKAAKKLAGMGFLSVPVLYVRGDWICGFSPERYAKAFVEEVAG